MPQSPSTKNSSSAAGSRPGKARRKSKPTSSRRNKRQKVKEEYAKAREDAQLAGVIPTTPEGAVRDERVPAFAQRDPLTGLPDYIRRALRESWATPDVAKPGIIASLLRPFFEDMEVMTEKGPVKVPASPKLLNELARTIASLDQRQYERDNPEAAGKARGGHSVSVQMHVQAAAVIRAMVERGEIGEIGSDGDIAAVPALAKSGAPSDSGQAG